uniref:Large ribosomal subunit protein eL38 n=1 Tax=Arion vulgaris TaxID=1028688 RepID=A0A0B7BWC4_9EUPU
MPKQLKEVKDFLRIIRRKDATSLVIKKDKKNKDVLKYKLRSSKYLYTLVVKDANKGAKLRTSIPAHIKVTEIK